MNVVYYGDSLERFRYQPTVYLDGPKVTTSNLSWRKKLLEIFQQQGFTHTVIIPECRSDTQQPPYGTEEFYQWETIAMNMSTMIVFWIPRNSALFPGLDINDRWGYHKHDKNVILGYPPRTQNLNYQGWYARSHGITMVQSLENIVQYVKAMLDQFSTLEFTIENGSVTLPPSEDTISNVFIKKMIERMGKKFFENVTHINVPWSNPGALRVISENTQMLYLPTESNSSNETFVFSRRENWESMWHEPLKLFPSLEESVARREQIRKEIEKERLINKEERRQRREKARLRRLGLDNLKIDGTDNNDNTDDDDDDDNDNNDNGNNDNTVIKTVPPEQVEKMRKLAELRIKLGITDQDLKLEEELERNRDRNIIDNDNNLNVGTTKGHGSVPARRRKK